MCVCVCVLVGQSCPSICNPCSQPQAPLSMKLSRQEYWMGSHSLLQRIFPTQGMNPGLLHCRQILYQVSHQGSSYLGLSSVQFSSVAHSCPTLCNPMNRSMRESRDSQESSPTPQFKSINSSMLSFLHSPNGC